MGVAVGIAMGRGEVPVNPPPSPSALAVTQPTGSQWQDLTATQKQILLPLAGIWDSLNSGHKGKWIALTQNYGTRSPDEQKKMQSRMLEWAALSQSQREQARLNFAETKKVSASARAADWETYQSLSDEEKRDLAAKGKAKPTGAAVAVTPVPPNKLTPVPITRHTASLDSTTAAVKPKLDANTLLPVQTPAPIPVVAPVPAPVSPSPSLPLVNADTLSPN
ncbi:MAG: DUF3106 domain-containing protein [Pseudomonadota bacterium]